MMKDQVSREVISIYEISKSKHKELEGMYTVDYERWDKYLIKRIEMKY